MSDINKQGAVTSIDVARLTGVSQSTVSRAFTPGSSISKKNRALVLSVAARVGYRPNAIARTLSTRQSRLVAVVAPVQDNPFYDLAIRQLSSRFHQQGYRVLLFFSDLTNVDELLVDSLQYQAQGIVLLGITLSSPLAEMCEQIGVPVVLVNRRSQHGSISSITSANYHGGQLVGEMLFHTGHRNIAYVAGLENTSTSQERESGLLAAMKKHELQLCARAVGNFEFEVTRHAIADMLKAYPHIDSIFLANDYMAIAAIDALHNGLSLRVPEDISVVGFDDIPAAGWSEYNLTTVEQPVDLMIEKAVEVMLARIARGMLVAPQQITLPVTLVKRGSVRDRAHKKSSDLS